MKKSHTYIKIIQLVVVALALVAGLVLIFGLTPLAHAQTDIYVRLDGNDVFCDGTADAPYPGSGGPGLPCAVRTIQKGISLVDPGGAVHVAAGTYVEDLIVDKSLILAGAGQGSTILHPATKVPTCTTTSSLCNYAATSMCIIRAENVTIHDLTLDGNNPSLTSRVRVNGVDVDARNGIIGDHYVLAPDNLTVYSVTVENVYWRGIYGAGNAHITGLDFHDNVVRNVAGLGHSAAIAFWEGAGSMVGNTVEDAARGLQCEFRSGCLIQDSVVSDTRIGVSIGNNLASSGAVTVTGNTISGGATGIDAYHQPAPLTVISNSINGAAVGIAIGGGSTNPLVANNQIDGRGAANPIGIVVETDGHVREDRRTSATLRDNDIYRTDYGVALYSGAGLAVTAVLDGNLIRNTLASSVVITGPGSLDVSLGNSMATANTFQFNSGYLVQLINAADDVPARFNDWGITDLDNIEADIHHQVDSAALGEVLYYGLAADAAPAWVIANGSDSATITATLTGLYAPQGNLVTFVTSRGTLSNAWDTTTPDKATTSIVSTASGPATITASAGYRTANATVTFLAPPPHHFRLAPIGDQVAGVDFTITVTAEDSSNNLLPGYDGQALLSDATGTVAPTSIGPFVGGVWAGPVRISRAYEGDVLTATYPLDPQVRGTSNPFTVSPAREYLPIITKASRSTR
jgi:hypothetical protein